MARAGSLRSAEEVQGRGSVLGDLGDLPSVVAYLVAAVVLEEEAPNLVRLEKRCQP
jgi:hypothetical protein